MELTSVSQGVELTSVSQGDGLYPPGLRRYLGAQAPETLAALGNLDLLGAGPLGLFASVRCPGSVILQAYDLARALRDRRVAVIGGFHSPMERECLALLLRGTAPVIVCPARALNGMRIPTAWREPLRQGRLLALSPFAGGRRRTTAALAERRNLFAAALAGEVLVAHAAPGSRTEAFAPTVLAWGKRVWTLDGPDNAHLIALGARPVAPHDIGRQLLVSARCAPSLLG